MARSVFMRSLACAGVLAPASALADAAPQPRPVTVTPIEVTAPRELRPPEQRPTTTETVTAEEIATTVNAVNAEDALRYLPNILVRKRHVGDTQAPITTRTSGVGASARSLIYADGVLLSALIGNNNSTASPRWGMVASEEIARVEALYGPFSAAYAGNSIGAVVEIVTRMPERREGSVRAAVNLQSFDQYGTQDAYLARQVSGVFGDRLGEVAFWVSAVHTRSDGQPLAYVTALRPAAPSTAGAPVTGGFADRNRTGAPIAVLGAGGLENQAQTTLKLKLAWDIAPGLTATYSAGRFANDTEAGVQSYLAAASGEPVYAGTVNLGGYAYSAPASTFSNTLYRLDEVHWMQSLGLASNGDGRLRWSLIASRYDYDISRQVTPSLALPAGFGGGPGSILRMDGTGWRTFDLKAVWTPDDDQELSFGAHADAYELASRRYLTANWRSGDPQALAAASLGRTRTTALWAQQLSHLGHGVGLTLGGRWERWRADDGFNFSAAPALSVRQPERVRSAFSPKASLAWMPSDGWTVRGSVGRAYRFPTVTELYQAVSTGPALTVPDPTLRPERALSTELSFEARLAMGRVRLSAFTEQLDDALISQTAPLAPGSASLFSYVQNVDEVRTQGVELVAEKEDLPVPGVRLSGSLTYVNARVRRDAAFPAAEGKRTPQVPRWRATLVATWRPSERLALTLAGRYSSRVYATIDNSDRVTHTYQGFDRYLVLDARVQYRLDRHWTAAVGVENLGGDSYFLFHPFPQRTLTAELRYGF